MAEAVAVDLGVAEAVAVDLGVAEAVAVGMADKSGVAVGVGLGVAHKLISVVQEAPNDGQQN